LHRYETWKVTKRIKRELQSFINKFLRETFKILWPNQTKNCRNGTDITLEKESSPIGKQALNLKPQGQYRRGRRRKRQGKMMGEEV
jgi:hypothetical protein